MQKCDGRGNRETQFQKTANRVAFITIAENTALSVFKFMVGILAHSNALISDAIHSASDVFSTIVVIIGIKLASKESDKEHPYGHERLECVAAIILAGILLGTGIGVGFEAVKTIVLQDGTDILIPGKPALVAAMVSIITKEAMYWYTRFYAKRIQSDALMADAWHHRSDAFSSVGALAGIWGARCGYPALDAVASLVIFLFIVNAALRIFKDAIDKMVDHACAEELQQQIRRCVLEHPKVISVDLLKTRMFGNRIYVDIEIGADCSYTLQQAHEIAEEIHVQIENVFPSVKHIMVHVNPILKEPEEEKDRHDKSDGRII